MSTVYSLNTDREYVNHYLEKMTYLQIQFLFSFKMGVKLGL